MYIHMLTVRHKTLMEKYAYVSIFFANNGDQLWDRVIVILIDEALSLFGECIYGFWRPPRDGISVSVILSALVIKSMSDLVAYDNTNSTIV